MGRDPGDCGCRGTTQGTTIGPGDGVVPRQGWNQG